MTSRQLKHMCYLFTLHVMGLTVANMEGKVLDYMGGYKRKRSNVHEK